MQLKAPQFWFHRNLISLILLPLSLIYHLAVKIRNFTTITKTYPIKTICVGNVTVGGSGKTPYCIKLAKHYLAQGLKPCFITRGYGGSYQEAMQVNPEIHPAKLVGDEALLLSLIAPVFIAKERSHAFDLAMQNNFDIAIMDDGLQNTTIHKDRQILIIDGLNGIGNGFLLPAGPLREPLNNAFNKASEIVIIGEDTQQITSKIPKDKTVTRLRFQAINGEYFHHLPVIAFAGIGNPAKFFLTLKQCNAKILLTKTYADHYPYSNTDLEQLFNLATLHQASLVTTEKDWVRIPQHLRDRILVLKIELNDY